MSPVLSMATLIALGCYCIAMLLALWRMLVGPSAQDRILAFDVLTVVATLVILALGIRASSNTYFEAALLLALFGFVSTAALAKFLLRGEVIE